jgi:hypothetical protein
VAEDLGYWLPALKLSPGTKPLPPEKLTQYASTLEPDTPAGVTPNPGPAMQMPPFYVRPNEPYPFTLIQPVIGLRYAGRQLTLRFTVVSPVARTTSPPPIRWWIPIL